MFQQLALPVSLNDDARFANFFAGDNSHLVHTLKQQTLLTESSYIFLWGAPSSGVSHLLQASCHHASESGLQSIYLPLNELVSYGPDVLEGMDSLALVALDHLEAVLPNKEWEESLFHLFNSLKSAGKHLLVGSNTSPSLLNIELPDLKSRLNWGVTFQIHPLNDEQKIQALMMRADQRGFTLAESVARYLLQHSARDLQSLFQLLEKLDQASLAEHRKLTIPFVKTLL